MMKRGAKPDSPYKYDNDEERKNTRNYETKLKIHVRKAMVL